MCTRIKRCIVMSPYLLAAVLLLAGCVQARPPAQPVAESLVQAPQVPDAPVVALPEVELSSELLYEYLLTEIASQRGHAALAVEGSRELAQKTKDPRLAKRAAQLALESGDLRRAVDACRFWQELEPEAPLAARLLSQLLLRSGRLDEARTEFAKVLKSESPALVFMQLYPLTAAYPDKSAILKMVRELANPYPAVAEAHWLVAQLMMLAGDESAALLEVGKAAHLRPEWDMPVLLEASLLRKSDPKQGLSVMQRYLSANPAAREVRLQYARALLEQKQYSESRAEFQILARENPGSIDLAFAVALISLQLNDLSGAEAELRAALAIGGKGQDTVEYFLGQLKEAKENEAEALAHYQMVKEGEYLFSAQLRVVYLLEKQGRLDQARHVLQHAAATTPVQRVQVVMIEAQMLGGAKQYKEAYRVLEQGLLKFPDHHELLYEAAMQADKLGKYEASEKLLRRLIALKPDHAHAYNALGYSMLERNVRVAEALVLVEKALQLTPDDYAIMDSVGWGYFRAGRLDESVTMLQRAFKGNPDPEIAAHLGEALWAHGDKEQAEKIWQESLKSHPDSVQLPAVMKRYLP